MKVLEQLNRVILTSHHFISLIPGYNMLPLGSLQILVQLGSLQISVKLGSLQISVKLGSLQILARLHSSRLPSSVLELSVRPLYSTVMTLSRVFKYSTERFPAVLSARSVMRVNLVRFT